MPPVVIIAGPTASGKSALALAAALRFDGEIINADSMQIYRELSVLTARPSISDEALVPHHLYGVLSASEACSAGRWLELALEKIKDVQARGKLPIICGGTGLYVKVLCEGIANVPDVPAEVLEQSEALYMELAGDAFVKRLADLDPVSAAKLVPSDRQRLIRAYSVVVATGRSLPEWHKDQSKKPPIDAKFFILQLMPDRARLYEKIERRFDAMLDGGGLDEVIALVEMQLDPSLPAMKALGVPELKLHIEGELEANAAIEQAKKTTRNLAKRQLTWFRNQGAPNLVLNRFGEDGIELGLQAIAEFLGQS